MTGSDAPAAATNTPCPNGPTSNRRAAAKAR
jgi:hypothetical protein